MAQRRCRECHHTSHTWGIRGQRPSERLQEEAIPFESMQRCSRNRIYPRVPMLDDQVMGCKEAGVVGGTAAAVAVAAAAGVPVRTAAAVAKGLTNAAAVFGHFRVPTVAAAAFHQSPQNRQNHYVGRRSPPPRPCRKPPTASAWGSRWAAGEGTFDCITSFTLRLAYALRTRCSTLTRGYSAGFASMIAFCTMYSSESCRTIMWAITPQFL